MAKFAVKITMDDGTIIDDVTANLPDVIIPSLISACEDLKQFDSEGSPLVAGRAITSSLRWFLTNLVKEYTSRAAAEAAKAQTAQDVGGLLDTITIQEGQEL